MSWPDVLPYVVAGALVSWPVAIVSLWLSSRKTRAHVDRVTAEQTGQFEQITERQTDLLRRGRAAPPGPGYQGHDHGEPHLPR